MDPLSRRNFLKHTTGVASGLAVFGSAPFATSCINTGKNTDYMKIFIPMPLQVVIDDVGWWSGEDGNNKQEPYRTGINRKHYPADYQAIADLGKKLGIRPQAAIILGEWDRENILRNLPSATWMGDQWDNSKWVGPWLEEAAQIIRDNRDHLELTIHGIGHEYWENGTFTRAEWTDSEGKMRHADQVELHLEYFKRLMDQNNLGELPESFVPAAFRHSFGPSEGNSISLAEILKKHGVNYINTPFTSIFNKERIQHTWFGFDAGVMTVDRGQDEFPWTAFPGNPSKQLTGPTCGMHWPNLLHPDPARNSETVEAWVRFLKPFNESADMLLASDSVSFRHQLAHRELTNVYKKRSSVELDFTETDKLPGNTGKEEIILKISSDSKASFTSENIKIIDESLQTACENIYTLKLQRIQGKSKAEIKIT